MNNSDDKQEYLFSAQRLKYLYQKYGWTESQIGDRLFFIKDESFILSGTSIENLKSKYHWKKFADNGKGIAIEIEILNNQYDWDGCFYSKIKYGELTGWKVFISKIVKLIGKNTFTVDFDQVLSFHKSPKPSYQKEEEVRLLIQNGTHGRAFNSFLYSDISRDKYTLVRYFRLPLYLTSGYTHSFEKELIRVGNVNNPISFINDYLKVVPYLKISGIYFGQEFTESKNFNRVDTLLKNEFFKIFGYDLKINKINYTD